MSIHWSPAFVIALLLVQRSALADAGRIRVSAAAGVEQASPSPGSTPGGEARVGLGLSELWELEAQGSVWTDRSGAAQTGRISMVALARFDVLSWVPYAGLGVGGHINSGSSAVSPELQMVWGADYLWSRSWATGVRWTRALGLVDRPQPIYDRATVGLTFSWEGW